MGRNKASLILFCATLLVAPSAASAVTIDWTLVGNPGNVADTTVMSDGTTGYGSVPYVYNIGAYDVTNSQYVEFLNAKQPDGDGPLHLYNSGMSDPTYGGINYDFNADSGQKYSVIEGNGNHPVTYVNWFAAIRFANWLNNGQGSGDTETGAYTLEGGSAIPRHLASITRNADATIFLPNENEWYKAAYYNPAKASYYEFPTSSNTAPNATGPTSDSNSANYNDAVGFPTAVDAYSGTTSPYGAYDMGGNVFQWNETSTGGSFRGLRGGAFTSHGPTTPDSSSRFNFYNQPINVFNVDGFRVASIPEPATFVLGALGGFALLAMQHRRKNAQ